LQKGDNAQRIDKHMMQIQFVQRRNASLRSTDSCCHRIGQMLRSLRDAPEQVDQQEGQP
jgi:hypothetical protein